MGYFIIVGAHKKIVLGISIFELRLSTAISGPRNFFGLKIKK